MENATVCVPKHPKRVALAIKILSKPMPGKMKFDIGAFGHHEGDHAPNERNYCGTTACAWGRVALDKRVQKSGVRAKWARDYGTMELKIKYRQSGASFEAAELYFGIPYHVARWLFYPGEYANTDVRKSQVVARLKRLLNGKIYLDEYGYVCA